MKPEKNVIRNKAKNIFKNNKHLLDTTEVKELIALTEKIVNEFEQVLVIGFAASELRDLYRKRAGIL